ncbi:MAG: diadenylate cyclase CdaA, partial [Clostridia bacterium]|nr:diadenylate cyclase CdaA [Clostridia bacterium]
IGIIALVILFQPELRRMLDTVGRSKLPSFFKAERTQPNNDTLRAIAQLVETCGDLSKTKTGALIVIERETKLGEIMKTGTIVNADISSELLKNIFFNKAPLHDGAVVIRDNRIAAAGCFLPLSSNKNLSNELGTRHRAGVGISEASDALVLIVSEETGSVSVATDGLLKRHLSSATLTTILNNELVHDAEMEEKLERFKFWKRRKSQN